MFDRSIAVPLADLRRRATDRPAGYLDDVLSRGVIEGDTLFLSEAAHRALAAKYRGPLPREQWPKWVKAVAFLRADPDTGIGDTIARTIGPVGGDAFKAWFKRLTGKSCGCTERQEGLNRQYPYHT